MTRDDHLDCATCRGNRRRHTDAALERESGRLSPLPIVLALAFLVALSLLAQEADEPRYNQPLGIALEGIAYPYPVELLPLTIDGQPLRMAFMDVPASAPANGHTVVLLHGKNFYGAYWEGTIKALSGAGYRVIVPDQLGFGRSSKPDLDYSFDLLAANTRQLLDERHVDRAILLGHSMGGMLAVRFARTYPERVERLVLEDPLGLEDYRLAVPPQSDDEALAAELKKSEADIRREFAAYTPNAATPFEPYVATRARLRLSGEFPRWANASARTAQMIYRQPVRHELARLAVPLLLIVGEADRTSPGKERAPEAQRASLGNVPQLARDAAREVPGARVIVLPGLGHVPHLEAPALFHETLLRALAQ